MVKFEDRPVRWLNELEYIDGKIWANVYTYDEILLHYYPGAEIKTIY